MSYTFEDKVALITGGARGIGLAIGEALLKQGVKAICILDLCQEAGEEAVAKYGAEKCLYLNVDVTNSEKFEEAFSLVIKKFGTLNIVVNNAGFANENKWRTMIDLNSKAVADGCRLAFKHMDKRKTNEDSIVINVSSIGGVSPSPILPLYSATKQFVIALTRAYGDAHYYDLTGIKFYAICPVPTETPLYNEIGFSDDFPELRREFSGLFYGMEKQSAEKVGQDVIDIINEEKNGSIWISEAGKKIHEMKHYY